MLLADVFIARIETLITPMELGFTQHFLAQLDETELSCIFDNSLPVQAGRVCFASRDRVRLLGHDGPPALLAGRQLDHDDPVVVGDWLLVDHSADPPLVKRRLERTNVLRRRSPRGGVQAVAANLDVAMVCMALGHDFNLRRVERWLALCHEADIPPLVVLTKADPGEDLRAARAALARLDGTEVVAVSALHGVGLDELREHLRPGGTATLLGSSGVGKSTLINALLGKELQATGGVREDDHKGRHTTTSRALFRLPSGALLIDNPGVREVGLVDTEGVDAAFPELEALLGKCHYRDCSHEGVAGCALDAAVADGRLSPDRLAAWKKLAKEAAFEARRNDRVAMAAEQRKWKRISQANRQRLKASGWQKGQKH